MARAAASAAMMGALPARSEDAPDVELAWFEVVVTEVDDLATFVAVFVRDVEIFELGAEVGEDGGADADEGTEVGVDDVAGAGVDVLPDEASPLMSVPSPQGVGAPPGWVVWEGAVVAPEASAIVKRVVQ